MQMKTKQKLNKPIPFGNCEKWQRVLHPILLILSVVLWIAGAALEEHRWWLCLLCMVLSGWEILWSTVLELQSKKSGGYLTVLLSLLISFLIGCFRTASAASVILYAGFWLAASRRNAALSDIDFFDGLLQLRGRIREKDKYVFRDAVQLAKGTVIEVFPGETVPADGVVVSTGEATLDYSAWMQRDRAVQVGEGSVVYCGALNHGQPISVKVTASGEFTLAQKMRAGIRVALGQKSTIQIVLSRLLPFVTLVFVISALIAGVFVPLFDGDTWREGLGIASGILLIAGTWSVTESIDLAFAVGVTAMCRRGVLFKSCRQIMLLKRLTDMIFSKTGTLTERNLQVDEIVPHNNFTKEQLLGLAAMAEQVSDHLIAAAILKEAGDIPLPKPKHHLVIAGEGVCVDTGRQRIYVGNDHLMRRAGVEVLPYRGHGIICFVAVEEEYVGCIILRDALKAGAAKAVEGLFACGIRSIDLITGDKRNNAEAVGSALGVHRVFAELNKKAKIEAVERNVRKDKHGGRLAFVGDETDTECLRAADISFVLKTVEENFDGTSGDIAVMSDEPMGVLQSFYLSVKLRRVFTTLLIFVFTIKIATFIFLCYSLLPLWTVALIESGLHLFGIGLAASCRKILGEK